MVILLVHDDDAALQTLAGGLAHLPQVRCETARGIEAAQKFAQPDAPAPDVVVTPVDVEGITGKSLVAVLRHTHPKMRAIFLAPGDLTPWASELPGELILPADPLPVAAIAGWLAALDTSGPPKNELGDYQLLEVLSETADVTTYRALQRSVQRVVALELLKPARACDRDAVRAFRALVRAKAAVVHQRIAAVYEAQEIGGSIFYTRELVDGTDLTQMLQQGRRISPAVGLSMLAAAAEAETYFRQHGIPRGPLTAQDVILARDGLPRVTNIALGTATNGRDERGEMLALVQAVQAVVDAGQPSAEFQRLLGRVRDQSPRGIHRWTDFAKVVTAEAQRAAELQAPSTRKLSAANYAAVMKRRRQRQWLVAGLVGLVAVGGLVLSQMMPYWTAPKARALDEMVRVPAGPFVYQNGETRTLPDFWIGKYEVTIAQYAAFLDQLAQSPSTDYDHPKQPASKMDHTPLQWNLIYREARRGGAVDGFPIDLNCPVTGVDYWDAWAYAKWRGHRLPTEEEWEKAARGTDGQPYPWGKDADLKRANTGVDSVEGAVKGSSDGFAGLSPVDAHAATDASPFGVVGLAGNVMEWTDSRMLHPERLDEQVPVLRGGSYLSKNVEPTIRRPAKGPGMAEGNLGFRTASSTAP